MLPFFDTDITIIKLKGEPAVYKVAAANVPGNFGPLGEGSAACLVGRRKRPECSRPHLTPLPLTPLGPAASSAAVDRDGEGILADKYKLGLRR